MSNTSRLDVTFVTVNYSSDLQNDDVEFVLPDRQNISFSAINCLRHDRSPAVDFLLIILLNKSPFIAHVFMEP